MPTPSAGPTTARRVWKFAEVEAYGVQRWLGELALALPAGHIAAVLGHSTV